MRNYFHGNKIMENAVSGKKRKLGLLDSELPAHLFQLKTLRLAAVSPANSLNCEYSTCQCVISSDNVVVSAACSSHGSSELEKVSSTLLDLEIQKDNIDEETADSLDCRESANQLLHNKAETSLWIEVQAESGELESTARPLESNSPRSSTAEKMPSRDELEEFFAAAEKNLQKKFMDKYNFDIAKDEPLEGRYEWVHIQPKRS